MVAATRQRNGNCRATPPGVPVHLMISRISDAVLRS